MSMQRPNRTLGPGHDTFWVYCNKCELRLQRCTGCGHITWPVLEACECCCSTELAWARMSGQGKLASWCTMERDYYAGAMSLPQDCILVELAEGPLFLSNPHGFTWRDCVMGMPLKLAFTACEDSAGPFNLPVFERA